MGIIACIDTDGDLDEKVSRARMVNEYLHHPNDEDASLSKQKSARADTSDSEEMETKIQPYTKREESVANSSENSSSVMVSSGLLNSAKKQIEMLSNVDEVELLDPEECDCYRSMYLPDLSLKTNAIVQPRVDPEPLKVRNVVQEEDKSINSSSMILPDFSAIPQVTRHSVMPAEPSRIVLKHRDIQSLVTRDFTLCVHSFETDLDEIPNRCPPYAFEMISSQSNSSENLMAAHVFGKNHCFRENPQPLDPLAELLNDKGKLSYKDEVRVSNTPNYVKELLKQIDN